MCQFVAQIHDTKAKYMHNTALELNATSTRLSTIADASGIVLGEHEIVLKLLHALSLLGGYFQLGAGLPLFPLVGLLVLCLGLQ